MRFGWPACALAFALAGCGNAGGGNKMSGATDSDPLTAARAAIVAHNYGDAAQSARAAVAAAPHDPRPQFELARAEALLGNQGNALTALEQSVTDGLANAGAALADPAFDAIRNDARFIALHDRALPASRGEPNLQAGSGSDAVSIVGPPGHEEIRAGDVTLNGAN